MYRDLLIGLLLVLVTVAAPAHDSILAVPEPADSAGSYRVALPGYRYEFPRDNFNHPDFQTEWWYYTGNLKGSDGHRFGFELTFFRQGLSREGGLPPAGSASSIGQPHRPADSHTSGESKASSARSAFVWPVKDIYLAHFALTDLDGRHYFHDERLNRAGPGLAGASEAQSRIWNGNWEVRWNGNVQLLQALTGEFALELSLSSLKPPVIHGVNGVSQKANGSGKASYYISLTRLAVKGILTVGAKRYEVTGLAWMDHEFFTHQLDPSEAGWDWMGLQLDDGSELMLYRLRRRDGSADPNSAGTYVDAEGQSHHLTAADFSLKPDVTMWSSPVTGATYPVRWHIQITSPNTHLDVSTSFEQQEFVSGTGFAPSYWEGAVEVKGTESSNGLTGVGYLEMTGYDHPLSAN